MSIRDKSRVGSWRDELRFTVPWLCSGKRMGLQRDSAAYPGDEPRPRFTMDKVYDIFMLQKVMASWEQAILGSNRSGSLDQI